MQVFEPLSKGQMQNRLLKPTAAELLED